MTNTIRDFQGQWQGLTNQNNFILVNAEVYGDCIKGRVTILQEAYFDGKQRHIWAWSIFQGSLNEQGGIDGVVGSPSLHERYGDLVSESNINEMRLQGFEASISSQFTARINTSKELRIDWVSKYPSLPAESLFASLKKPAYGGSKAGSAELSWSEFKDYAQKQPDGLIYRGQARNWRLQTSFHRNGGADLIAYLDDKIPAVENHINSISSHVFNTADDKSLAALLNLAQHHGYPTPLLDWSRSPYIAAFFAFENPKNISGKNNSAVRIFTFNDELYASRAGRHAKLRVPTLILRTLELPGIGNQRSLPQQAITMFSNVDDIESLIQSNEKTRGELLNCISIPASERVVAMKDLARMGITWGSIYPGLDGICKQLAYRHFSIK